LYEHFSTPIGGGEMHIKWSGRHRLDAHNNYSFLWAQRSGVGCLENALTDEYLVCPSCLFGLFSNKTVMTLYALGLPPTRRISRE
jgi:hypothetical protein